MAELDTKEIRIGLNADCWDMRALSYAGMWEHLDKACDEIDALRAEIERLSATLMRIALFQGDLDTCAKWAQEALKGTHRQVEEVQEENDV